MLPILSTPAWGLRIAFACGLIGALPGAHASLDGTLSSDLSGAEPTSNPNILIVMADDLGVDMLRFYGVGGSLAKTPVLDTLAARGVVFDNAWATPICGPSRMVLQTGRLPFRTGIGAMIASDGFGLLESEWTLPEIVDTGTGGFYDHAAFGKWPLKNVAQGGLLAPNVAGWNHFAGTLQLPSYYVWNKVVNGVESISQTYVTTDTVDEALEWASGTDEPWMMYLGFNAPHFPFHTPPAALHSVDLSEAGGPEENPEPYYRAMIEALDTEIGRLIAQLDPGLEETVLIFLSDNGTPGEVVSPPYDPAKAKATVYQGGVQIPLMVVGPSVSSAGRSDALVSIADLFATVAELTGTDLGAVLPAGYEHDSVSLVPYLVDPDLPSQREIVQTEVFLPNGFGTPVIARRAARGERYKLIQRWDGDELYDLELDPLEEHDLLLDPLSGEQAAAHLELATAIEDLHGFLGASVNHYGCPPLTLFGTLTAAEQEPVLGEPLTLLVDNTLGTQQPGAATLIYWNTAPDGAFPCGASIPGWGMAGGDGEFLLSMPQLPPPIAGPAWSGEGPAQFSIKVPLFPALVDGTLYVQGMIVEASMSAPVPVALTNAIAIQLAPSGE